MALRHAPAGEVEHASLTAAILGSRFAVGDELAVHLLAKSKGAVGDAAGHLLLAALEDAKKSDECSELAVERALDRAITRLAALDPLAPAGISIAAWRELLCARLGPQALISTTEQVWRLLVQLFQRYPGARNGRGLASARSALRRAGAEADGRELELAFVGAVHRRV